MRRLQRLWLWILLYNSWGTGVFGASIVLSLVCGSVLGLWYAWLKEPERWIELLVTETVESHVGDEKALKLHYPDPFRNKKENSK